MKTTHIYGIRDLETQEFVYVGKSNEPQRRLRAHVSGGGNKGIWKLAQEKGKDNFGAKTLEIVQFEVCRDWVERERFWVKRLRKEGHPLCNKNGGGGGPAVGYHLAEETKAKMRKPKSEGHKANLSKSLTGREFTDEHCANISKALIGRELAGEHRTKLSKAKMGHETTDETRAKIGKTKAKPYPAFYNVKTQEFIPAGQNLMRLCREQDLNYLTLQNLKLSTHKQSRNGWQLACASEMVSGGGVAI